MQCSRRTKQVRTHSGILLRVALAVLVLALALPFFPQGSLPALAASTWATQTVDSSGVVGEYTSLAFDPSGNPAISYYDSTNGTLKFASADITPPSTPSLVSSANGANTSDTTPTLDWSDVSDASGVSYSLQVDNNSDFSSPNLSNGGLTASTYTLTSPEALANGIYYWRVKAVDGAGNESAWTSAWSFTIGIITIGISIEGFAFKPAAVSVASGTKVTWTNNDAVAHTVTSDTAVFNSGNMGQGATFSFTFNQTGTFPYHCAFHPSMTATVVVTPLPPPDNLVRLTPANDNTPTFAWSAVSGAASYEVKIDAGSYADIGNVSTYTVSTVLSEGSHTFSVRAKDAAGNAGSAASLAFAIDTTSPAVPSLVSPTNAASTNDTTPAFDWGDVTDTSGVSYNMQIDDNSDFSSPAASKTGLTSSQYELAIGEALAQGTYYWRVKAVDGVGNESGWTASRYFTIDTTAPSAPTLVSPADGAKTNDTTPTLDWSDVTDPSGVSYSLQVDNNSDFSSPILSETGLTTSTYTLANTEALAEGTYYWRVRAVDGAGNQSGWTSAWSFTIDTTLPAAPTLVSPADAAKTRDPTPTLDWSEVTDPSGVSYSLQVDDNSDFSSLTLSKTGLTSSTYTPTSSEALADATYYWRAKAADGAGNESAWSSSRSFTVDTASAYTWATQTVDSSGIVGEYTSLAFDPSGNPAISYSADWPNYGLRFARWTGTAWDIQWVDWTGNKRHYTSLAFDPAGNPAISYSEEYPNYDLKFALWTGTAWDIQWVDYSGYVGDYTSLAFDPQGNPAISYYDGGYGDLKFARWTGTAWNIQVVDNAGYVGLYTSLAFDPSGNPTISYYDWDNGNLKYARWTGSTWDIQTVDSSGYVGYYTSLAFDPTGKPAISYYDDYPNYDLKYALWTGSSWNIQVVDNAGFVGGYTSLAFDPQGNPTISYYDVGNGDLKLARWNGTGWNIQTVDSSGDVGYWTSLAFDPSGNPTISYYDAYNGDLKVATVDNIAPATPSLSSPAHNTYTNSNYVALDWTDVSDPSGVSYSLQVDNNSDFSSPEVLDPSLTSSQSSYWLSEGTYYWRVRAVDGAGNPSDWTTARSFTIDTTAPTVSLASTPSGTITTTTPTFAGSATDTRSPIASVSYQIDGGNWTAAQAQDGAFDELPEDFTFTTAVLSEGYHYMYVKATDAAGNESSWAYRDFTVDSQGPTLSNISPAPDSSTGESKPNIKADFSDSSGINTASFRLWVDGVEVTGDASWSTGSVSYTPPSPLSLGAHTVKLQVGDNVGTLTTKEWSFTVINTPPQVSNVSASQRGGTTIVDIGFDVSDSQQTTVTVSFQYWDGAQWQECLSATGETAVTAGRRTGTWNAGADYPGQRTTGMKIRVVANDGQPTANIGSGDSTAFILDTKAPSVPTLETPANGASFNYTPQVNWSDVADPAGVSYSLQVDTKADFSSPTKVVEQPSLGSSDYWLPGLSEGTYYWRVRASDGWGNQSAWTTPWSFTIDTTAPTFQSLTTFPNNLTNTPTPTFSGVVVDARAPIAGVRYQLDWKDWEWDTWIEAQAVDGAFDELSEEFTLTIAAVSEGGHHIEFKVRDAVGNESGTARDFTVDSLSPSVSNLNPAADSTIEQGQPDIRADFSDSISGINTASFRLYLDGVEVSEEATWNSWGNGGSVSYTPASPLSLGLRTVKLEVGDMVGNLTVKEWSFTVGNSAPQITSLNASQRGGERIVDISFTVSDSEQGTVILSFQYWDGTQWQDCQTTTGEGVVDTGYRAGTWDAGADYPGKYTTAMKIRVIADDGQAANNQDSEDSVAFILDTKAPSALPLLQSPSSGAYFNYSPQLNWSDVTDPAGVSYRLQVDSNSDFSSPEVDQYPLGSSDYNIPWIGEGTFYWKVRAVDGWGNQGDWTAARSFTIDQTPPSRPENLIRTTPGTDTTPTFTWSASSDALSGVDSYEVKIDGASFTSVGNVTTYTVPSPLSEGGHQIAVRAKDKAENLSDENTLNFNIGAGDTTPPAMPSLASPAHGTVTTDATPTLDWSDVSDPSGVSYILEIDVTRAFSSPRLSQPGLLSSQYPVAEAEALPPGEYFWRVKAVDGANNESGGTEPRQFIIAPTGVDTGTAVTATVTNAPPPMVDAKSPADTEVSFSPETGSVSGAILVAKYSGAPSTSLTFTAGTGKKILKYIEVYASFAAPGSPGEAEVKVYYTNSEVGGWVESSLLLYYWDGDSWEVTSNSAVEVANNMVRGEAPVAALRGTPFAVGGDLSAADATPPSVPALLSPAHNDNASSTPTLSWQGVTDPSGVVYYLQVDNSSDFSSPAVSKTSLTSPSYTLAATEALSPGTYFWRIKAVDGATPPNESGWSSFWSLVVQPPGADTTPPPTPGLIGPPSGTAVSPTPTLDWSDVSDLSGVKYVLEIDDNPDFSSLWFIPKEHSISSYTLSAGEALPPGTYYWRVRARDEASPSNESGWSPVWSFRVEGGVPGKEPGPPPLALLILVAAALLIIGFPVYLMVQKRKGARELAGYERQLKEWEAEGFDVSKLRKKYFGKK